NHPSCTVAGHGHGTTKRAQGALPQRGCAAPPGPVAGAVRGAGRDRPAIPGGPAPDAAVRQGPSPRRARTAGILHPALSTRILGLFYKAVSREVFVFSVVNRLLVRRLLRP